MRTREKETFQLAWQRNYYLGDTDGPGTYSLSLANHVINEFLPGFDIDLIRGLRDMCQEILDFDEMNKKRTAANRPATQQPRPGDNRLKPSETEQTPL